MSQSPSPSPSPTPADAASSSSVATATATGATTSSIRPTPLPTDLTWDAAVAADKEDTPRLAIYTNATAIGRNATAEFARLFPFLSSPEKGVPIHGVCQLSPITGELALACPLPSSSVWKQYTDCRRDACRSSVIPADIEACVIAREEACAWIAATSTLCVPLSLPPLRAAQVYLPKLPVSVVADGSTTFRRLLATHHKSLGISSPLVSDVRVTNASATVVFLDPALELGVCLPTVPVGTKCDPTLDPTTNRSSFSLPWTLPLPRLEGYTAPPTALTADLGQPEFPKSFVMSMPGNRRNLTRHSVVALPLDDRPTTENATDLRVLQPPAILLDVPTVSAPTTRSSKSAVAISARDLMSSTNVYSLVYCHAESAEYRAKHLPRLRLLNTTAWSPCSSDLDCLFDAVCDRATSKCGASFSSRAPLQPRQDLGNDQTAPVEQRAPRDLSSLTVQLIILGLLILMLLVRHFRHHIFSWWAAVNHRFKGASTTAQRELTLQPASNYMLDDLHDGRRGRGGVAAPAEQEVDPEFGLVTVGDSLPRYNAAAAAGVETLPRRGPEPRQQVQRSDTVDTLTLPPPFTTTDRSAPAQVGGAQGEVEVSGTTGADGGPQVDSPVTISLSTPHVSQVEEEEVVIPDGEESRALSPSSPRS